jgi:hypothetical protein
MMQGSAGVRETAAPNQLHAHTPIHMGVDLWDIKQYRVPSLAPKPRDITLKGLHTHVYCMAKLDIVVGTASDASCEPEVHGYSLEKNQCFHDHFEVSMAENSQAFTT